MILFFQCWVSLLLCLPSLKKTGLRINKESSINLYFWRIVLGLTCYACLFYIYHFIPLSQGLVFQYSGGLWIPLISLLWLGLTIKRRTWLLIVIGFAGVVMQMKNAASITALVFISGAICGLLQGVTFVQVRKLTQTEPVNRMLFYYFGVGTIATFPLVINQLTSLHLHDIVLLIAIGLFTYIGQFFIAYALKFAHATTLAPFTYMSILFGGLFDWFIFHNIPNQTQLFGMLLIIAAGLMITLLKSRKSH